MRTREIWLMDLGDPIDPESGLERLGVVVSPTGFTGPLRFVCPLTRTARPYPWRIEIDPSPENGLKEVSYVQTEHLRSISVNRGRHCVGMIDYVTFTRIQLMMKRLLDL